MNLNRITVAGNLTRDPELRYLPKGTAICKLSLAVNRTWKDDTGAKKEEVTFLECDAFGRTAETIAQYMRKGRPIYIEGRLKMDNWDDKTTGAKRSKLGIICESFQFIGGKGDTDAAPKSASKAPTVSDTPPDDESDSVPF